MTDQPSTSLATRPLSDSQIQQRIDLNKQAGYGLERASSAQLNILFLFCQKYDLLPGDDITIYEGKPWVTLDGRVKLMRRHPEYRGYNTHPLTKDEKEAWGYQSDDIVIECTVRTARWGDITARGKVTRAEINGQQARANPVAKVHPVEMAEKRAISRAERLAFGTDAILDEEEMAQEAQSVIESRTSSPERTRELAARHEQIFGTEEDWDHGTTPKAPAPAAPAQQHPPRIPPLQPSAGELVPVKPRQRTREELCAKYQELFKQAQDIGIPVDGPTYYADETTPREELIAKGKTLSSLVAAHQTPEPAR